LQSKDRINPFRKDPKGLYFKLEEEHFMPQCDVRFEFKVKNQLGGDAYIREIGLLKYSKFLSELPKLKKNLHLE
jgi:hypothetical protein